MRILTDSCTVMWSPLETYKAGTPVRFRKPFHDKHKADDLFMVNAVCNSYRPDDRKYCGKICVSNLRTGEIAYLDKDRRCIAVKVVVAPEAEEGYA